MENKNKKTHNNNDVILYGRHAVLSAIQNPNRKIYQIFCTDDVASEVLSVCAKAKVPEKTVVVVKRNELEKMLPAQSVHQGFAARCEKLKNCDIQDFCRFAETKENSRVLILDQVTDPQNIGAIIRSAVAFDCDALILQDKNAPEETGAMAKASVGMIEHLPIVRATNLSRAIEALKKAGYWIVGMDGYAKCGADSLDKSGKIAVVMGSEGKGMRRLIEEACDITVRLPMSEKVESLNVSTAAAIILYELYRK